jgi:phospholipid/cholesterol/gamma-HCH transport system substrate-binding protein
MTDKMKNILIGLFVAAAVTIMVSMILFLEPKIGDGKRILHVRFTNISGIAVGTRVTFAGKPVGEVLHIREIKDARSSPADESGRLYIYELTLKTDSTVDVYSSDEIAIKSMGLMGEKSVAILPKSGSAARVINSEVIYASSADALETTFNQMTKMATRIESTVGQISQWFDANSQPLTHTISSLDSGLSHMNSILANAEKEGLIPSMRDTLDVLNENLRSIRSSLVDEQLLHRITNLTDTLTQAANAFNNDAAPALQNLNHITRDIAQGNGTLGRFISTDDFYLHLSSLLSKAETLMNDVNHYGILFQYDKGWQRSRTKKANLLKALDTPKEFRNYFEGEVDSITTSMGRLAELLERSEVLDEKQRIAESENFKKRFADLLRHSQSLTDMIKLYNEGLAFDKDLD